MPVSRKGRRQQHIQEALDLDITGERRKTNTLIKDIRREVERWRANNWNGVTPYTRKLLAHWHADPRRPRAVLPTQAHRTASITHDLLTACGVATAPTFAG